jgi:hypothetical protein
MKKQQGKPLRGAAGLLTSNIPQQPKDDDKNQNS